jgi:methylated-DNA-protein-cysteine methyltransferase-like protein
MSGWDHVYKVVKKIPRGRVTTYGEIARASHVRGAARAAGHAMAACPNRRGIPWHRVVGAGGRLLISEPHASLQRKLLETEGVTMTERRVNMKLHSWSPVPPKSKPKRKLAKRKTIQRR